MAKVWSALGAPPSRSIVDGSVSTTYPEFHTLVDGVLDFYITSMEKKETTILPIDCHGHLLHLNSHNRYFLNMEVDRCAFHFDVSWLIEEIDQPTVLILDGCVWPIEEDDLTNHIILPDSDFKTFSFNKNLIVVRAKTFSPGSTDPNTPNAFIETFSSHLLHSIHESTPNGSIEIKATFEHSVNCWNAKAAQTPGDRREYQVLADGGVLLVKLSVLISSPSHRLTPPIFEESYSPHLHSLSFNGDLELAPIKPPPESRSRLAIPGLQTPLAPAPQFQFETFDCSSRVQFTHEYRPLNRSVRKTDATDPRKKTTVTRKLFTQPTPTATPSRLKVVKEDDKEKIKVDVQVAMTEETTELKEGGYNSQQQQAIRSLALELLEYSKEGRQPTEEYLRLRVRPCPGPPTSHPILILSRSPQSLTWT